MYELWQVVKDMNGIIPIFLIDKGDFGKLYSKFKENKSTIITKNSEIVESHFKYNFNKYE
jgi:hypothetical protein